MRTFDIKDFRNSGVYLHAKAQEPHDELSIEDYVRYVHDRYFTSKEHSFTTLKDAHTIACVNSVIEIPLGRNAKYDGIYDIWLHNCSGITSITLCFGKVEIPIHDFKLDTNVSIQIPLAFAVEGKEVKHVFHNTWGFLPQNEVSFIPSIAFLHDNLVIKLNKDAECEACISTIYYSNKEFRMRLLHARNIFYINGEPYATHSGGILAKSFAYKSKQACFIS